MKLGIVISTQPTKFAALPFKEGVEENVAKVKNLGFDGVELAVRNPEELNVAWMQSILDKNDISVMAIQTGQVFLEEGLCFVHPDPDIRAGAIERIKSHVRLAGELGAMVIIGLVRGKDTRDISDENVYGWLSEGLQECARENNSVRLIIEPINRYETDNINTVESGVELMEKVGMDNVGLLLDTFHMNIEEPSMAKSIIRAKEHIFHFHVADSNRWYPGAGHINFPELLETLDKVGYSGFISAECLPLPDGDTAARKTIEYMRSL